MTDLAKMKVEYEAKRESFIGVAVTASLNKPVNVKQGGQSSLGWL